MEIKKNIENGKVIYKIKGRVDTQTSTEFQLALDNGFELGEKDIVLDFKEVEYLSSAGLRVVLYAQKKIKTIEGGGDMEVVHVSPSVMEVFEMTGFTDIIKIKQD